MTDQRLRTRYLRGEIAFGAPNLRRNLCRLCVGSWTTELMIALVGAGPTLLRFRDFIGIILFGFHASEDSRSHMGGSDVVHCVRFS